MGTSAAMVGGASAFAQQYSVSESYQYGQSGGWSGFSTGSTLYISPNGVEPGLDFGVVNTDDSCTDGVTVNFGLSYSYTDPGGYSTFYTYSGAVDYDEDWELTGSDYAIGTGGTIANPGGSATLSFTTSDGGSGQSTFLVLGAQPSLGTVEAQVNATSPSWFYPNQLREESGYSWRGTLQFTSSGYPNWGTPHGIGLTQVDPPLQSDDYWSWLVNLKDGISVLQGKKSGAYAHWQQQLANWTADGKTQSVPPSIYSYCDFQYPQGPDSFADADWIHAYNGNYYTLWVRKSGSTPGHWSMDGYNHSGYLQSVCNTPPL